MGLAAEMNDLLCGSQDVSEKTVREMGLAAVGAARAGVGRRRLRRVRKPVARLPRSRVSCVYRPVTSRSSASKIILASIHPSIHPSEARRFLSSSPSRI